MYLKLETSDMIEECLTIDVDGVQVYPVQLTEEQQKEETFRLYGETVAEFKDLLGKIKDQGFDVSATLDELLKAEERALEGGDA